MFAPIRGSPVTLSKTTPFIEPDPEANNDCVITNSIAANAYAIMLRAEELPRVIIYLSFKLFYYLLARISNGF
jgi:hypothetical protein